MKKIVFLLIIVSHNTITPLTNAQKTHIIEQQFLSSLKKTSSSPMLKVLNDFEIFQNTKQRYGVVDFSKLINKQYHGRTALHYLARTNDIPKLTILLQFGANVNALDYKGRTVTDCAPKSNRNLMAILIDAGGIISEEAVSDIAARLEGSHI